MSFQHPIAAAEQYAEEGMERTCRKGSGHSEAREEVSVAPEEGQGELQEANSLWEVIRLSRSGSNSNPFYGDDDSPRDIKAAYISG